MCTCGVPKSVCAYSLKYIRACSTHVHVSAQQHMPASSVPPELFAHVLFLRLRCDRCVLSSKVIDDPSNNKLLLVMEYIDGGMLVDRKDPPHLRRFSEETARSYFRDLVKVSNERDWVRLGSSGALSCGLAVVHVRCCTKLKQAT